MTASRSRPPSGDGDGRLHHRDLDDGEWISRRGMLVTRPSRIAADLLTDHEGPEAVGHLVADAIRAVYDYPSNFADSLARSAAHFGLRRRDGIGLLRWLLDLVGDPDTQRWMDEAHAHVDPDVARLLEDAVHRERRPMKQVVNDALRRALTAPSRHGFRSGSESMNLDCSQHSTSRGSTGSRMNLRMRRS